MSLAEGVSGSVRYKAYATGVITSNTQPVSTVDPAVSGGQILRRVASTLKLEKATYQSAEIRTDRQIQDFRHGVKRVTGGINGELSPRTYFDFFEASARGTKGSSLALSNTDFTSAAADNPTSKFTFASGDPVASGIRTGDILRFTNLSDAGNNAKNFLVTGFGGVSNRDVTVFPAPNTMGADATFNLTSNGGTGKVIFPPSTVFTSRKFAIEVHNSDVDQTRLFCECREAGWTLALPATGLSTCTFPFMGRDMETYSAGSAPFFTAPAAGTTTGIFAAVNGLVRVNGATVGVVTGANLTLDLAPSADAVVGQNFPPEVFLGRQNLTGQITAFFEDLTLITAFKNETLGSLLLYLTTTSAVNSPAMSIYVPALKFGDGNVDDSGEGGQQITLPFQALKADGSVSGDEATTWRIVDTEAV